MKYSDEAMWNFQGHVTEFFIKGSLQPIALVHFEK